MIDSKPPRFDYSPFGSPVSWVTGLLVAGDDLHDLRPFGTGFLAGPGVAITARHVIDEVFRHFTSQSPDDFRGACPFGLQVGTADVKGGVLTKWDVVGYHYSRDIDITGLVIEPADVMAAGQVYPRLNLLPPKRGEQVVGAGYANTTWRAVVDGSFKVSPESRVAYGTVEEVHHMYRDRSSLPFPCFHTNARFDPGMSGGPVFNEGGQVCGVVSTNLPPSQPEEEHASYVSLIWPAMGLRLSQSDPAIARGSIFIRDEAALGRLQVLNLDWMSVAPGMKGDHLRFAAPPHTGFA